MATEGSDKWWIKDQPIGGKNRAQGETIAWSEIAKDRNIWFDQQLHRIYYVATNGLIYYKDRCYNGLDFENTNWHLSGGDGYSVPRQFNIDTHRVIGPDDIGYINSFSLTDANGTTQNYKGNDKRNYYYLITGWNTDTKDPIIDESKRYQFILGADGVSYVPIETSNPYAVWDAGKGIWDDKGYSYDADAKKWINLAAKESEEKAAAEEAAAKEKAKKDAEEAELKVLTEGGPALIWQTYLNYPEKDEFRDQLNDTNKATFDKLLELYNLNKTAKTLSLTLDNGVVAVDLDAFNQYYKNKYDTQKSEYERSEQTRLNNLKKARQLGKFKSTDNAGWGVHDKDVYSDGTTYNMRDLEKYGDTYDRLAEYMEDPTNYDFSKISNRDAYRMRRMLRHDRKAGVTPAQMTTRYVTQESTTKANPFVGKLVTYQTPHYITTYEGVDIPELAQGFKSGGILNYLNLFD